VKLKGVLAILVVAAAAAAFWPAAGGAATFRGVVVAKQHGTLLVTSPSGVVRVASGRAAVGSRVAVTGRTAAVVGRARSAVIRGIVVRRVGTTMFLSSNRHLLAIHNARRLADTAPTAPQPGAIVSTQVSLANGELEEQDENEVGEVNDDAIQVQATIAAVAAGSVTLNVQGQLLTVALPAGLTLPASLVGQTVTISLSLREDDQGDDNGGDDDGGDHHGGGGGDG
jgi:hypothetical protein